MSPASRLLFAGVSLTVILACFSVNLAAAADAPAMPQPPKVSTFAPAGDLANQVEQYTSDLEKALADEGEYKEAAESGKISRACNTLIVLALALGLHDEDNKFKTSAGAIMKAARDLAATQDLASAKKALAALKDAAEGKVKGDAALKWEKVASLAELMKEVPLINNKLKRNVKGNKFKSKAKETGGYTATLAVIAQGAVPDTSAAKDAAQVKQWYEWSVLARDYAGKVNAAIHAGDEAAADEAMKKMTQNCDDCHAVFKPGAAPANEAK